MLSVSHLSHQFFQFYIYNHLAVIITVTEILLWCVVSAESQRWSPAQKLRVKEDNFGEELLSLFCLQEPYLWIDKRCADLHRYQGAWFSLAFTNFAISATNDRFYQTRATRLKWPRWVDTPRIIDVLSHLHQVSAHGAQLSREEPGLLGW